MFSDSLYSQFKNSFLLKSQKIINNKFIHIKLYNTHIQSKVILLVNIFYLAHSVYLCVSTESYKKLLFKSLYFKSVSRFPVGLSIITVEIKQSILIVPFYKRKIQSNQANPCYENRIQLQLLMNSKHLISLMLIM